MKNYIFFIGGSGARAYTAFIHCAAAGVLKTTSVSTMMIDADVDNKANERSRSLYRVYRDMYGLFKEETDRKVFTCDINMETETILSPMHSNAVTLENAIGHTAKNRQRLLDCLYTREEKEQDLKYGFYAHPNIGCVFFSDFDNQEFNACVQKIDAELNSGKTVSIALVGSIFGGTGAAGIPTILKLLRDKLKGNCNYEKLFIGGVFFTPYFTVSNAGQRDSISIDAKEFYFNTYEALSYYQATPKTEFQSIYLVGQEELDVVNSRYVDGGAGQDNKPHVVELYAALAIDSFFSQPDRSGVFGAVRKEKLNWTGFPRSGNDKSYRMMYMADFARAQAVFVAEICGYVERTDNGFEKYCKKWGFIIPQWYKKYNIRSQAQENQLEKIKEYSDSFLDWLYKLNCIYDEAGNPSRNANICLFGGGLDDVYHIAENREKRGSEIKENLKKFRDNFNTFVDTASNVDYILDKALKILSMAGIGSGASFALGAAGLFLKIVSLAGGRRQKELKK